MVENHVKKEIIKDWADAFSGLSVYSQNKLYKVVGPLVVGIELLKVWGSEEYRPIFVVYSLWNSDSKKCLRIPAFLKEIHNRRDFQCDIPYAKHKAFFQEAVACTAEQTSILTDSDISLQQLFDVIDKQFFQPLIRYSPTGQALLFESKLFSALYTGDTVAMNGVFDALRKASQGWAPNLFEWAFGKLDVWFEGLEETVGKRDEFLKQIGINKTNKNIAKLKSSELYSDLRM